MNTVTITGNLTRDPQAREAGDKTVVTFGVGRSRTKGDERISEYYEVEVWEKLGENIMESLSKGDPVFVTGRLRNDHYEVDGGEKRSKTYLVADDAGPSMRFCTCEVQKNGKE